MTERKKQRGLTDAQTVGPDSKTISPKCTHHQVKMWWAINCLPCFWLFLTTVSSQINLSIEDLDSMMQEDYI